MGYKILQGHIEPISRFRVPFYVPLVEEELYGWVPDYIEEQHLKAGIIYHRGKKKEFLKLPPIISDLRLKLEKSHDAYLNRCADKIINFVLRGQTATDPFARLERRPDLFQYIGSEILDRILAKVESGHINLTEAAVSGWGAGSIEEPQRDSLVPGLFSVGTDCHILHCSIGPRSRELRRAGS